MNGWKNEIKIKNDFYNLFHLFQKQTNINNTMLSQSKLTGEEWKTCEIPVSDKEKNILLLMKNGFYEPEIKRNPNLSLLNFLKINPTKDIEIHIFNTYFKKHVLSIEILIQQLDSNYITINPSKIVRINSADLLRLNNNTSIDEKNIFEFVLLQHIKNIVLFSIQRNNSKIMYHCYTLHHLMNVSITHINSFVLQLAHYVMKMSELFYDPCVLIENSVDIIEKNHHLTTYADIQLHDHQKQINFLVKQPRPKLIFYICPTASGKTITPVGLQDKKIIFVCASRRIGLQLARSCISVDRKIAFSFGVESSEDIRLHYFSAKEYTKNKRSGGIKKVDNSVGDNVEIMICDIKSYLIAMHYMLEFNKKEDIVMFYDEPTITLDYETHELHEHIANIWKNNVIPNIILSSATLPKMEDLDDVKNSFLEKMFHIQTEINDEDNDHDHDITFDYSNPIIECVQSYDCKKTIPILDNAGYCVLLHYLADNYEELISMVHFCETNLTLLRYLDLEEIIRFILTVHEIIPLTAEQTLQRHFYSIECVTMMSIKQYYLYLIKQIPPELWPTLSVHFHEKRIPKLLENDKIDEKGNRFIKPKSKKMELVGSSAIYITTKHAYTLTNGPTIYLCENVDKIATFCIQQARIPSSVMENIMSKIHFNNEINEKIVELEKELEFQTEKNNSSVSEKTKDSKKNNRETEKSNDVSGLTNEINTLRKMIKCASLNDTFIPNTHYHKQKWAEGIDTSDAFASTISESYVNDIMSIPGVDDNCKLLLLMGIGIFDESKSKPYLEIMKSLADQQHLFMVIANSDHIYGTNYNFCHAYIGKDLQLTQEKMIQAIGRVGRNNIQQTYTVRVRDNAFLKLLFMEQNHKIETINMNKLFQSR